MCLARLCDLRRDDELISVIRWTVALSTRSGPEYVYYPMGRETILTPVAWPEGKYPIFDVVNDTQNGPLPPVNKDIRSDG